jgi:hypothetical protein
MLAAVLPCVNVAWAADDDQAADESSEPELDEKLKAMSSECGSAMAGRV